MHRLLILSRHAEHYERLVRAAHLPDLAINAATTPDAVAPEAASFDVALGEPSLLRALVPGMTRLRWIQATWAGVEPLLDPSLPRGYTLTNARGVFGALMSEYVFAYALAHERLVLDKWRAQQEQRWDPAPPGTLRGKLMGLLGVGTIGAAIARTAKHFDMRVRGFTRQSADSPHVDEYYHRERLAEFPIGLDYLVAVMPATAETRRLVNQDFLERLPPTAVFINPGRGGLVDEPALAAALSAGRLAAAVLDVFDREPLPPDHVFWTTPRLLISSHTAALSKPEDIAPLFIDNYRRLLRGEPLRHQVNFELGY